MVQVDICKMSAWQKEASCGSWNKVYSLIKEWNTPVSDLLSSFLDLQAHPQAV